ncbi:MAG: cupin domain-containing protein [Caulobacteraceae bacterium]
MPFIDTRDLPVVEKLPGWRGRLFHSKNMTFAHWEFDADSLIHEHLHDQEEVWHVLEGELEVTIDGTARVAGPGHVAIVPTQVRHSVRALSDGRAIVCDHPVRGEF